MVKKTCLFAMIAFVLTLFLHPIVRSAFIDHLGRGEDKGAAFFYFLYYSDIFLLQFIGFPILFFMKSRAWIFIFMLFFSHVIVFYTYFSAIGSGMFYSISLIFIVSLIIFSRISHVTEPNDNTTTLQLNLNYSSPSPRSPIPFSCIFQAPLKLFSTRPRVEMFFSIVVSGVWCEEPKNKTPTIHRFFL